MSPRRGIVALAFCLVAVLGACNRGGGDDGRLVLDGRPRVPDQEGVVVEVSRERITLDGGRTYRVSPKLQSFATQTMQAVPLLGRKGQFVHVGLDGDTMVWFATVADSFPGEPPTAYYTGVLKKVSDGRAYFRDGTVLRLGEGVEPPVPNGFLQVEIDPKAHVVRRMARP